MLPQGDSTARGGVIKHNHNAEGNSMSNANANPILELREYEVQFKDGKVNELTVNVIAKSMYSQYNPEGNQYVLFDCFVNFRKKENDLTITNPNIVVLQDVRHYAAPPLAGNCPANGKMDRFLGGSCLISRSCTLFRLPNMLSRKELTTNSLSIGGYHMS